MRRWIDGQTDRQSLPFQALGAESWPRGIVQERRGVGSRMVWYIERQPHLSRSQHGQRASPGISRSHSPSRMKLSVGLLVCLLVLGADGQSWWSFVKEAGQGTRDMWRAYSDMREANFKNSDKYFHARGNYDAARRGPGGVWAARVLSDARENIQGFLGRGAEDTEADQFANRWGRSGKDPNHFRPKGLPDKY